MTYDSDPAPTARLPDADRGRCRSIDWYSEGQTRIIEVGDVRIEIRFVGRRGRRGRIAITGPAGTVFRSTSNEFIA